MCLVTQTQKRLNSSIFYRLSYAGSRGELEPIPASPGEGGQVASIAALTFSDKQSFTLTFAPMDNSEKPINLIPLDVSGL